MNQDASGESLLSRGKGFRDRMVKLITQAGRSAGDIRGIGNPAYIAAHSPTGGKAVTIDMVVPAATNDGAALATTYKGLVVVGYDAGAAQKNAVRKKLFLGSITQDPYQIGYKAVELAYKAAKGEAVADLDTGAKFYDSTNMDQKDIAILLYD